MGTCCRWCWPRLAALWQVLRRLLALMRAGNPLCTWRACSWWDEVCSGDSAVGMCRGKQTAFGCNGVRPALSPGTATHHSLRVTRPAECHEVEC
jgi:hypothetical protein